MLFNAKFITQVSSMKVKYLMAKNIVPKERETKI